MLRCAVVMVPGTYPGHRGRVARAEPRVHSADSARRMS